MTDVVNIYGKPGDGDNSTGRLIKRIDESGSVSYTYGRMGETTTEAWVNSQFFGDQAGFLNF